MYIESRSYLLYLVFEHTLDFIAHGFGAGLAEMDAHLVGSPSDFLYQHGGVLRRSGRNCVCGLHGTGVFAHDAPFSGRDCAVRPKSVVLTVNNVLRRLFGGPGIFLPKVFPVNPVKEDRGAPFQDTVIDMGVGQVGRVLQFAQLQVCGDDHGPAAAVAAVNDEKHLLHRILGAALYSASKASRFTFRSTCCAFK